MTSIEPGPAVILTPVRHRQAVLQLAMAHAVRRDLERLVAVLADPVTAVRRDALASHLGFLLDQVDALHRLLDGSIWPPAVAEQTALDQLAEQARVAHDGLDGPIRRARAASAGWKSSPMTRGAVLDAVRAVQAALEPVLDLDASLLPQACAALPDTFWVDVEPTWPSLPTRLARRLFWLLDALDPATAEAYLHRTPPWVMWVLRNGFSGAYNRAAYLMWSGGGTGPAS